MNIVRKWVQEIAAGVVAEKEKEWAKSDNEPEAMDGKTEDGLLLCYAWEKKLIGAEDALRRVRLWQKEYGSITVSFRDYYSGGWATVGNCMMETDNYTLRGRIRQIALEADAEIKARDHKAAQRALKGTKK